MKLFPAVTLSQLRMLREQDRLKLHASTADLQALVRAKARPVKFLLDHPGMLAGGLASLVALYEVGTSVLSPMPLGAAGGTAKKTLGIAGRLARVGLGFAMKAATPVISSFIQKAWRQASGNSKSDSGPLF